MAKIDTDGINQLNKNIKNPLVSIVLTYYNDQ